MPSPSENERRDCILAIEPDTAQAATLSRLLRTYLHADFVIVKSTEEALRSLGGQVPDLVLTSAFLPPADEAALTALLRNLPAAGHVQVITVPHFIDFHDTRVDEPSGVLSFLERRSALQRPVCDPRTVRDQIEHYLERARAERERPHIPVSREAAQDTRATIAAPDPRLLIRRLTAEDVYTLSNGVGPRTYKRGHVHAKDRRRAPRRAAGELESAFAVKLPFTAEVSVVNISRTGVLLSSSTKLMPGSEMNLRVMESGTELIVPARTIRSQVGDVNTRGVTYLVAAAFGHELDSLPADRGSVTPIASTPSALAKLLVRVLSETETSSPSDAPTKFVQGVRGLLRVRDVQLRDAPDDQADSVYFTVPTGSRPVILQVIFERDHPPCVAEFKLLKAAATMAAVVIELAPGATTKKLT